MRTDFINEIMVFAPFCYFRKENQSPVISLSVSLSHSLTFSLLLSLSLSLTHTHHTIYITNVDLLILIFILDFHLCSFVVLPVSHSHQMYAIVIKQIFEAFLLFLTFYQQTFYCFSSKIREKLQVTWPRGFFGRSSYPLNNIQTLRFFISYSTNFFLFY
jgi:hypothetical protein